MALTDSTVEFTDWVYDKINNNRSQLGLPVGNGVKSVMYGDQNKIHINPLICVESGEQTLEKVGIPRKVRVTQNIYIIIYHSKVTEIQQQRHDNDTLMVAVKNLLHTDHTLRTVASDPLSQLALDSFVAQSEPGFIQKGETLYRASRLTFEIMSQVLLPC